VHKRIVLFTVAFGAAVWAWGQGAQGRGTATATVGGKKVAIDYGQPALKGRKFADLMKQLPGDRMWRAGAGAVTILSTDADLMVGGKRVPAGKYSVYIHCPETGDYSLVLSSDLGQPLGKIWSEAPPNQANEPYPHFEYTKEIAGKEVARVSLKHAAAPATDVLTYAFSPAGKGAGLTISWGDQAWSVDVQPAK
jgi:hypothetical protein